MNERELLDRYAVGKDQEAFGQLVRLHMDWVYGCARRMVHDPAAAEDVAQAVFILLARKAGSLRRETHLAGWLFRAARYCAAEAMRGKARRLKHEREAAMLRNETVEREANWEEIRPVVDEAVAALGSTDRNAVLLRFFRGMSLEQVGQAMGMSEEAAKKRVQRAVAKLRELVAQRGVSTSAGALGGALAMHLGEHAPAALVEATVQAARATGTATAGTAFGLAKGAQTLFTLAKMKAAAAVVAVSAVAVSAGTVAVVGAQTPSTPAQAATRPMPVAATPPAVLPDSLDPMYEKARRSSPDLEIMAGPNRFRVTGAVRWNGDQMVSSDGRGGGWNADPAVLQQIQGPRYASEDVAVVFVDTPAERFDPRRMRVFDHDRREFLQNAAVTRVPGASAFRISRWFAPLPPRIDLWLDLASYAAGSEAVSVEPKAGVSATIGRATLSVREVREGRWSYRSTPNAGAPAGITWGTQDQVFSGSTIVLDCAGPWSGGRYQIAAISGSGHKLLSDLFADFAREGTSIREFALAPRELATIELRPVARPGPFFFDGVAIPQRTVPMQTSTSTEPVVIEGQWDARFPSGPGIEIVAIGDPKRPDTWWTPAGEPTERPGITMQATDSFGGAEGAERLVCVRLTGLGRDQNFHLVVANGLGTTTWHEGDMHLLDVLMPAADQALTLVAGVSSAPVRVLEETPVAEGTWLRSHPHHIRTMARVGNSILLVEEGVVQPGYGGIGWEIVGASGKALYFTGGNSARNECGESGLPYRTTLRLAGTEEPRLMRVFHQPFEYVQFKDVPLNPK